MGQVSQRQTLGRQARERRAAAGQQHEHEVFRGRCLDHVYDPLGCGGPVFVRYGVAGLDDLKPGRLITVAVFGQGDTVGNTIGHGLAGRLDHRQGGLADPDHTDMGGFPDLVGQLRKGVPYHRLRIDTCHAVAEDIEGLFLYPSA